MKKKKLYSAFIMLLVTAIALTTASYAWFTQNSQVSLAGLDVNVGSADGIQISTDALNWKTALTVADITGAAYSGHTNQIPASLVPVSSGGTVSSGALEMFRGSIGSTTAGEQILLAERSSEVAGSTGDFIAFDIFLQTSGAMQIYLTSDSNVVANGTSKGLENAARVAFLNEGNTTTGDVAGAISLSGATSAIIWEPNSNAHTPSGIANALSAYNRTITSTSVLTTYQGVKAIIPESANIPLNSTSTTYFNTITPAIQTSVTPAGTSALVNLSAGITKIRIYAWVEGQDVDCENDASGSDITFNIKFTRIA